MFKHLDVVLLVLPPDVFLSSSARQATAQGILAVWLVTFIKCQSQDQN